MEIVAMNLNGINGAGAGIGETVIERDDVVFKGGSRRL